MPKTKSAPKQTVARSADDLILAAVRSSLEARFSPLDKRPDDPVGWMLEHFRIPREEREDMRLALAPYQQAALRLALSRDERGLFRYSLVLWGDIKKSIKSTIAAAVTLWSAWHTSYSQNYIVANTREQADSRVAYYLRRAIELNPRLAEVCDVNRSNFTVTLPNHAFIKAIAVNAAGEAGGNPRFIEFTEAWGATTEEAKRLWTETTTPPNLFGKSQRWVDTYAGFEGESEVLENIYDSGVTRGVRISDEYPFYENRVGRQFSMWNETPRLAWQTDEYYASEMETLTSVNEFLRVHRNQWSTSSSPFVPPEWWDACEREVTPYEGEPCVCALDAGLMDDSFGVLVMSKKGDLCTVRYANAWYPPHGGQIDFQGTESEPGPERELIRLSKSYNIIEYAYDKTHIADMMARLNRDHGFHIYDFSQGQLRLVSDKMLRDNIRDKGIAHSGEHHLRAHIRNANAKTHVYSEPNSRGALESHDTIRIVKRSQRLKIDLAVCASMALYELKVPYLIT